ADLKEMGDGWNRMRSSALGLLLSVVALAGLAAGVGGGSLRPQWIAVYGAAIGLSALAAFRLYFSAAHGVLPRRRGFDPNRVRQVPGSMSAPVLFCFVLAAALAGAEFSARWLNFIDGRPHSIEPFAALAWLAAAAVGRPRAHAGARPHPVARRPGRGRGRAAGGLRAWSPQLMRLALFLVAVQPGPTLVSPTPSPTPVNTFAANPFHVSFLLSTLIWLPVLAALIIAALPNPRGRNDRTIYLLTFWTNASLAFLALVA